MTFKTFLASTVVAASTLGPVFVFAQELPLVDITSETTVTTDPTIQLENELAELRTRENDPTTGFVARFFIHLKIREIENKLNIATALN